MTSPRQPAYDAVYAVIRQYPPISTGDIASAAENGRLWRAVHAALDAMEAPAAAGRLAHDCERAACPFEGLWSATDPKPDEAVDRLQAAFNDAIAEAEGARSDYEQLKGFNAELAAERDRLRQELGQLRRNDKLARPR